MTDALRRREAGTCLHISALPGPFGIGELGAHARAFIDSLRKMRLSVWQLLPIGPTAYGNSPYQSLSTFAGNELFIDVGELHDMGLLEAHELNALTDLPTDFVDYANLIPAKTRVLRTAAKRYLERSGTQPDPAFEAFVAANDAAWLHDYALFRTLKSMHGEKPWPMWSAEYVRRDSVAIEEFELQHGEEIRATKVLQFLFFEQWARLRNYARDNDVRLFGDMPIYIALDSADAWAHKQILRIDEFGTPEKVAGVPPDYFSQDGQLWGNPLYDWGYHYKQGFSWWISRLRWACSLTDIVRIDHFRGFESYWAVPAEASTARQGEWETGPGDALFAAARAALGELPIVAEDLGLITEAVHELRVKSQLPGMKVLQFGIAEGHFELEYIPEDCVCYTGTHDNDTAIGWFNGSPEDLRDGAEIERQKHIALRVSNGSADTIHLDLINAAFSTRARLAIAPLQDFLGLGSEARFNLPGTTEDNWRWRMKEEQIDENLIHQVATATINSGRCPSG